MTGERCPPGFVPTCPKCGLGPDEVPNLCTMRACPVEIAYREAQATQSPNRLQDERITR